MKWIIFILLGIYSLIVLLLYFGQRTLIYYPDRTVDLRAGALSSGMQVLQFLTPEQQTTVSWYSPPLPGQPVLVYFQGNAGSIQDRLPIVLPYQKRGIGILLVGYPGYGNPGEPSEKSIYQIADTALQYLSKQNISSNQIILWGESIGSAVAVEMATHHSIAGLILLSPFTSLPEVAQRLYPVVPALWLVKDKYDNLSKIKQIHVPLLILHGENDRLVPLPMSQKLFKAANESKIFYRIHAADHNTLGFVPGSNNDPILLWLHDNFLPGLKQSQQK